MNQLLRRALTAVEKLPAEQQDEIARLMLELAHMPDEVEDIPPSHIGDVLEGLAQSRSGAIASDTEVEAAFRRFD